jgi:hypothetical protein
VNVVSNTLTVSRRFEQLLQTMGEFFFEDGSFIKHIAPGQNSQYWAGFKKCLWTDTGNSLFETQFKGAVKRGDTNFQCMCDDCWDGEKKRPKEFEYVCGDAVYLRGWTVAKEYLNDAYKTMGKSNHDDFEQNAEILEKFFKQHFFTLWRHLAKDPGVFAAFIQDYDMNVTKS